ncbi:MAG: 4-hydroxyproline epimerase [Salibacteraceae bacterium]
MRIEEETEFDGVKAIVPSIEGWSRIQGYNTIIIDDEDPYALGFQVI